MGPFDFTLRRCSGTTQGACLLRSWGPGLLRIGELVEPSINGPFDFTFRRCSGTTQGACLLRSWGPGLLRIGELVEPSINGPFDFTLRRCSGTTQGSWAKADVFLGAEGRVTFAPRIAGAILERWSRGRTLRLRSGSLSFAIMGAWVA